MASSNNLRNDAGRKSPAVTITVAQSEEDVTKSDIILVSLSPAPDIITALRPPNIDGLQLSANTASSLSRNSFALSANRLSFSISSFSIALSHNSSTRPASGPYINTALIFMIPELKSDSFHFIIYFLVSEFLLSRAY